MKRFESIRTAVALAGLTAAGNAYADGGGITGAGWLSMLGVVGIAGVLYWVHKKLG